MDKLKEKEIFINDYLVQLKDDSPIFYNNIEKCFDINCNFIKIISPHLEILKKEIDFTKMTKVTFQEIIDIVDKFYRDVNIPFNVNKSINDGTIDFNYSDLVFDDSEDYNSKLTSIIDGVMFPDDMTVDVSHSGLISGAVTLVHELSHLRDTNKEKNHLENIFTESLAITDELIFLDYLQNLGYDYDAISIRNLLFYLYFYTANKAIDFLAALVLFERTGSLKLKDYQDLFKNDKGYEDMLNTIQIYKEKKINIEKDCRYIFGSCLAVTLFYRWKQDNSFMQNLVDIHNTKYQVNSMDILNKMGFYSFGYDEIDLLVDNLKRFTNCFYENDEKKNLNGFSK